MTKYRPAPATLVQRALRGHAAIGLLGAALLYIISLTGAVIVIHDRWQRWEQPNIAESATITPAAVQTAMTTVLASEADKPRTTHLYIRMPSDDLPRTVVTTDAGGRYVDDAGRVVARAAPAWTDSVIALDEYLHLPTTWGMILVGALGVVLAALVVTGVLAHPRILRDAFCLRTRHDPQIARADWHNRLGVWTLPFVLAVALTGAFIGLGSVGFTVLAGAYTGGNMEKAYAPIFGGEGAPDRAAAPLPDIATALRTLAARVPDAVPTYVIVHDPATRGQHTQIIAEHPRRLIYGESYNFDAAGGWRGPVGLSDGALGKQAAASAYNLHFGNFGGLAVELAYMLLGVALCVITATGVSLWLHKRQRRGLASHRLRACWDVVVWGSPLILVGLIWLRAAAGPDVPLGKIFWGAMAAGVVLAMLRSAWITADRLRLAFLLSVVVTAVLHAAILQPRDVNTLAIDGVAFGLAAAMLALDARTRTRRGSVSSAKA